MKQKYEASYDDYARLQYKQNQIDKRQTKIVVNERQLMIEGRSVILLKKPLTEKRHFILDLGSSQNFSFFILFLFFLSSLALSLLFFFISHIFLFCLFWNFFFFDFKFILTGFLYISNICEDFILVFEKLFVSFQKQ